MFMVNWEGLRWKQKRYMLYLVITWVMNLLTMVSFCFAGLWWQTLQRTGGSCWWVKTTYMWGMHHNCNRTMEEYFFLCLIIMYLICDFRVHRCEVWRWLHRVVNRKIVSKRMNAMWLFRKNITPVHFCWMPCCFEMHDDGIEIISFTLAMWWPQISWGTRHVIIANERGGQAQTCHQGSIKRTWRK
jgi:hypothetical protein